MAGKVLGRGDRKWTSYSLNSDFNLVFPFSGAGMAKKSVESGPVSGPAGRFAAETPNNSRPAARILPDSGPKAARREGKSLVR